MIYYNFFQKSILPTQKIHEFNYNIEIQHDFPATLSDLIESIDSDLMYLDKTCTSVHTDS